MSRPETGPMQFGDDWPGIFIRGDNALWLTYQLRVALEKEQDPMIKLALEHASSMLSGCRVGPDGDPEGVTYLKPFSECLKEQNSTPEQG